MEIGQLRTDEVEVAVALWREAGLTRPWNDPHDDAALALANPTSCVLAGRIDGKLAATAMLGFDGHRAWVYYLAVAAEQRGKGHGRAMMRAAEAWARQHGAPKIQLMVRRGNAPVIGFYQAIGYEDADVDVMGLRF